VKSIFVKPSTILYAVQWQTIVINVIDFFLYSFFCLSNRVLSSAVPDFHCAQELIFYTKSFGIIVSTSVLST